MERIGESFLEESSKIQIHDLCGRNGSAGSEGACYAYNGCSGTRFADDRPQTAGEEKLREKHHGGDDRNVCAKTTHSYALNGFTLGCHLKLQSRLIQFLFDLS